MRVQNGSDPLAIVKHSSVPPAFLSGELSRLKAHNHLFALYPDLFGGRATA
jgi:hypothetical protein